MFIKVMNWRYSNDREVWEFTYTDAGFQLMAYRKEQRRHGNVQNWTRTESWELLNPKGSNIPRPTSIPAKIANDARDEIICKIQDAPIYIGMTHEGILLERNEDNGEWKVQG